MLFDIDGNEQFDIPHRKDYDRWRRNLSDEDHEIIMNELHAVMDEAIEKGDAQGENGIFNSSYIPGEDWTDTPYEPIYYACRENYEQAKLFYGLLVWEAVMEHSVDWFFMRQEVDDDRILGLTYIRRQF